MRQLSKYISILMMLSVVSGCKKLVDVDPPKTFITQTNVFTSDATAISVMTGMYMNMVQNSIYSGNASISVYAGLSSDEMGLWSSSTNSTLLAYYQNNLRLSTATAYFGSETWAPAYKFIYICNSAIEQLNSSDGSGLSAGVRKQLIGEAKFMRAFHYFYLVNLFGDLPLALNTDYKAINILSRTPASEVWKQIIADLKDAKQLLSNSYLNATLTASTDERVRPTYWAATAMLARVYLYTGNYAEAEAQATEVINNSSLFALPSLNSAFLRNSKEAIWQLQPVGATGTINPINTLDGYYFIIPSTGPSNTFTYNLNNTLVNSFEAGDDRKVNWVNSYTSGATKLYYPTKYKLNTTGTPTSATQTEYLMVLRLGEQYLIRAEARARLNNISGAMADINTVRTRARAVPTVTVPNPLPDFLPSVSQAQALINVAHERQVELFTELGHRWLDLKRTGAVDSVMTIQTPAKATGNSWNSYQKLYPVFQADILANPNLSQNQGY